MNILALDTADQVMSVALAAETGVWYSEIDAGSRHSELLMECVENLFKTAGLKPGEMNLAACMKGPGSFTGLRIGFSAAKGMALALGIPLIAVPTLDCLAHSLSVWPGLVLPALDAKKNCFFTALYRDGLRLTDYMDTSPEIIAKEIERFKLNTEEQIILTGSGAEILRSLLASCMPMEYTKLNPCFRKGLAKELLEIARNIGVKENRNDINSGPVYLRKSDAELKLNSTTLP